MTKIKMEFAKREVQDLIMAIQDHLNILGDLRAEAEEEKDPYMVKEYSDRMKKYEKLLERLLVNIN